MAYMHRSSKRRTDWGLNRFATVNLLRQAQVDACKGGDWVEAGAMALRFNLADCIQVGRETDAARLTRQLVRHLRANNRIVRIVEAA